MTLAVFFGVNKGNEGVCQRKDIVEAPRTNDETTLALKVPPVTFDSWADTGAGDKIPPL